MSDIGDNNGHEKRNKGHWGQVGDLKSNRGNSSMHQRRVLCGWIMQQRTPDLIRMHTLAKQASREKKKENAELRPKSPDGNRCDIAG